MLALRPLSANVRRPREMASATIKLFLVHGDPKRLRTRSSPTGRGKLCLARVQSLKAYSRGRNQTSRESTSFNPGALEAVKSGKADVMGSIKPVLFELLNQWPGSRVLDGRPGIDPHAMAMPKGRDLGTGYARQFIEDAKSEGLVKAAIDRAGLRGVVVALLR